MQTSQLETVGYPTLRDHTSSAICAYDPGVAPSLDDLRLLDRGLDTVVELLDRNELGARLYLAALRLEVRAQDGFRAELRYLERIVLLVSGADKSVDVCTSGTGTHQGLRGGRVLVRAEAHRRHHFPAAGHLVPLDGLEARALVQDVRQDTEEAEYFQGPRLVAVRPTSARTDQ